MASILVACPGVAVLAFPSPVDATPAGSTGHPCPAVEVEVPGVPPVANPFDPELVDVRATFTSASGSSFTTPAFAMVDYTRAQVGGNEVLTPAGGLEWKARFTPPVAGDWSWSATIDTGGGPLTTPTGHFSCAPEVGDHGWPVVSPADQRYLAFSDGSKLVPLGENLGWYGAGGTFDYDRWLDDLAAHRANWVRVWMPSWAMGIEWADTGLGDYTNRMDRAWQLDHVMSAARARGIVVQLVLLNHGAFSTAFNSEWASNPYNQLNGGPLATPQEFFTNPVARELFERRLRYVVARWGASPNVIWELWNEVDLTGGSPADVVSWHDHMAGVLASLDPYDHLVTTSIANPLDFLAPSPAWAGLWALDGIDTVQVHLYGLGSSLPVDFTEVVPAAQPVLSQLAKPVMLAEAGVDSRGPAETRAADPTGQGIHEQAWSGFFSGGASAGMSWWWDNVVEPDSLYGPMLDGLAGLLEGVDPPAEQLMPGAASANAPAEGDLKVLALVGRTKALAWVRNPANWWFQPDDHPILGASAHIDGLAPGTWQTEIVDAFTGTAVMGPTVVASGATTSFDVPVFSGEVAVRMTRTGDAPSSLAPSSTAPAGPNQATMAQRPATAMPRFTG